ncbi:MAG: phenylalanine--tRNA ligase subunit beta [Alphaproteobacteria bacterium]
MKFTINWLKRHLETDASDEEICRVLTDIGLELEEFEDKGKEFASFKVAEVISAEKHPDADKLKVCQVKTDDGKTVQVVCGAPNAREGMKAVFAPSGTYIPGLDVTLKKTKIRGIESNGMMVSEREMCLSDEHEGIIDVDDKYEIGTPIADIYNLDEKIIEIGLTPNRADCAGVRGIARDLAAAGLGTLKDQDESPVTGTFNSPIDVKIEDTDGCKLFYGRMIKNVKNGPSPAWLQDMLNAVGLRPISALVDITNLMTMDQCRPLHVFDADKIQGNIVVRTTSENEKIDALNDKSYDVIEGAVGITDDSGLIGLGGIVGGLSTGCTEDTTNVFVESAFFNPMRIARAGRDMSIQSDARYRFDRGVDPMFTKTGIEMATRLILELCGTDKSEISNIVKAGDEPEWERDINFDPKFTEKLCGVDVDTAQQIDILQRLGFNTDQEGDTYKVRPPSWRNDVEGAADLTEEVIRIYGYDKITPVSVRSENSVTSPSETQKLTRSRLARASMAAEGLNECVTWSFMPKGLAKHFGSNDNPALTLGNPISSELNQMRPSILPNLIEAAGRNATRGFADVALCEVGPVFKTSKPDGQDYVAAGIRSGSKTSRQWSDDMTERNVDAYDAKSDVLAVLNACGAPANNAQISRDAPDYYHPGRSGVLRLGKNIIAQFGEIHPAILDTMDIKDTVVGFEVFLENIPAARKKGTSRPLLDISPLQPLSRDFAFIVKSDISANEVIRAAKSADKKLITDADIFDVYVGKGVDDGHKSLALNITIQPTASTLTEEELEEIMNSVIDAVANKCGGVLRG